MRLGRGMAWGKIQGWRQVPVAKNKLQSQPRYMRPRGAQPTHPARRAASRCPERWGPLPVAGLWTRVFGGCVSWAIPRSNRPVPAPPPAAQRVTPARPAAGWRPAPPQPSGGCFLGPAARYLGHHPPPPPRRQFVRPRAGRATRSGATRGAWGHNRGVAPTAGQRTVHSRRQRRDLGQVGGHPHMLLPLRVGAPPASERGHQAEGQD